MKAVPGVAGITVVLPDALVPRRLIHQEDLPVVHLHMGVGLGGEGERERERQSRCERERESV